MKTLSRALVAGIATAALTTGAAGIAAADTTAETTAPVTTQDTPAIWVLPGVDLGGLLAPTTLVPGALAPVFGLIRFIGG
ncbi:hypothetical protein [Actinokineospora bangkokensis]|uniref:Secreted protein n=1 Tax=Actinokineospora bangkokensis TaxID=1193682 RepID=A0A1Q9LGY0_9PSEU|nr:hypothetical protein [Actinokineospora bangkokensis]OLR91270.1 hypothetical protein BJP25_26745 [Actinokineospora bangkokensis]